MVLIHDRDVVGVPPVTEQTRAAAGGETHYRAATPYWWWGCDTTPGSRICVCPPPAEAAAGEALALPGETLSVAAPITALFRARDRQSMRFAVDLWPYPDVLTHADAVLDQLRAGSVPCDSIWPTEHTGVFARWIAGGKNA